jgi:hypothetical protein
MSTCGPAQAAGRGIGQADTATPRAHHADVGDFWPGAARASHFEGLFGQELQVLADPDVLTDLRILLSMRCPRAQYCPVKRRIMGCFLAWALSTPGRLNGSCPSAT